MSQIPLDNLPESVRDIVELVGLPAALALVKTYGGIYLKVPVGRREGQTRARLIEIMGHDAAKKFIAHHGGERLGIPRCAAALRDERDRSIIRDYDAGLPAAAIAQRERLTERQVRNILKRVPAEGVEGLEGAVTPPQGELFAWCVEGSNRCNT